MSPIEPFRTAVHPDVLEDLHDHPGMVAKSRSRGCEPGADHSSIGAHDAAKRYYNLQRWTEMPAGGHFAAMEEPGPLVDDLRSFFRERGRS